MTLDNCIEYLVGNQFLQFDFCSGDEFADFSDNRLTIHLKRKLHAPYVCPVCGGTTQYFYDQLRDRTVEDIPWGEYRVFLQFTPHRICCPHCGKIHTECIEGLEPKMRQTNRFRRYLAEKCTETSVAEVARQYHQNPETVRACDKEYLATLERRTPKRYCTRLGIDEIAISKGHSYATVFYDHDRKCVIDMVEGRTTESVSSFFEKMGGEWCRYVEVVTMDLWWPFRKATQKYLKRAQIVTDRFHVHKYASEAMDSFRRAEFGRMRNGGEPQPKKCRFLLLRSGKSLSPPEKARIEQLRTMNSPLYTGYLLKESVETLYASTSYDEAREFLFLWAKECIESNLGAFEKLGKRLLKYAESILLYFRHHISNGFAEGINNKIKVVKRIAFGFHDFGYFRLKILNATGYLDRLMSA